MAKFLIFAFTLTLLVVFTLSVPVDDDNIPDKPGYCKVHGVDIKKGESAPAPIGKCYQTTCTDPETNAISGISCANFAVRPPCYIAEEDLTKPYPLCCSTAVCPGDE